MVVWEVSWMPFSEEESSIFFRAVREGMQAQRARTMAKSSVSNWRFMATSVFFL